MAVEPASLSQAQSVRRLSRREPCPRRRRRIRHSRRQPDKFLSRIDLHPPKASRGVSVRSARLTNFGLGHGSETRNSCTWRARPGRPLRPVSVAPHVPPEGLPAGVIGERLGVQPSSPSFHLAQLVHADLMTQRCLSRQLIYSVSGSGVPMTAWV